MKCEDVQNLISDYLSNEMPEEQRTEVQTHLQDCAACRALSEELARINDIMDGLRSEEAPDDLKSRLKEKLRPQVMAMTGRQVTESPEARMAWWKNMSLIRVAAMVLTVALVSTVFIVQYMTRDDEYFTGSEAAPVAEKSRKTELELSLAAEDETGIEDRGSAADKKTESIPLPSGKEGGGLSKLKDAEFGKATPKAFAEDDIMTTPAEEPDMEIAADSAEIHPAVPGKAARADSFDTAPAPVMKKSAGRDSITSAESKDGPQGLSSNRAKNKKGHIKGNMKNDTGFAGGAVEKAKAENNFIRLRKQNPQHTLFVPSARSAKVDIFLAGVLRDEARKAVSSGTTAATGVRRQGEPSPETRQKEEKKPQTTEAGEQDLADEELEAVIDQKAVQQVKVPEKKRVVYLTQTQYDELKRILSPPEPAVAATQNGADGKRAEAKPVDRIKETEKNEETAPDADTAKEEPAEGQTLQGKARNLTQTSDTETPTALIRVLIIYE